MTCFHVFVYGTLKPGERAFDSFCKPYVLDIQPAITVGRLYALSQGYPAMTLEQGWVQGVLLSFEEDSALEAMDEFEDYIPSQPEESLYQRIQIPVFKPDRQPLGLAWVYIMDWRQVQMFGGEYLADGCWSEHPRA